MKPLILHSREGEEYDIGTMTYRIKLRSNETGGLFSVLDFRVFPGAIGLGHHYHENCAETFVILSGKLKLQVGLEEMEIKTGDIVHIPKGTVHDFSNPFDSPCRFFLQYSPAGLEHFFEEIAETRGADFNDLLRCYRIVMV